jgi:hypothetical protein
MIEYFPLKDFQVRAQGGYIELERHGRVELWMTLFSTGVFVVREPGRGHAGRLPREMSDVSLAQKVSYALSCFAPRAA